MCLVMKTADNINHSNDNLSKLVRKLTRFQSTLNRVVGNIRCETITEIKIIAKSNMLLQYKRLT